MLSDLIELFCGKATRNVTVIELNQPAFCRSDCNRLLVEDDGKWCTTTLPDMTKFRSLTAMSECPEEAQR